MEAINSIPRRVIVTLIYAYRYLLSPIITAQCRFTPSCSTYTLLAIERFGVYRGLGLGIKRLSRCNPWCYGGYDPIPEEITE